MIYDDFIYDKETYPNCCTFWIRRVSTREEWLFEISDRRNDIEQLMQFMYWLCTLPGARMVGFNNVAFDYPILHAICTNYGAFEITSECIYGLAQTLIKGSQKEKWALQVWPDKRWVFQIDLFKIHHFDNKARGTSLKMLEFQMRMKSIQDLPFPVGTILTDDQKDELISYNGHDIDATEEFYNETLGQIEFREKLSIKYNRDCMNDNDTKIGKEYFIARLEEEFPGICYIDGKRSQKRQTMRTSVALKDVIFPYIQFAHPEFNRILNWLKTQVLLPDEIAMAEKGDHHVKTKGVFKDVNCTIDSFQFDFGLGGIHGSVDPCVTASNDEWIVEDIDVKSYYPNIAIANRLYPEHLSPEFCDIYLDVYNQRISYPKKSSESEMLKLALNGVYGDSNNYYSPFYDPQYTMAITINGQLLLCMLAEHLMSMPDLKMIQINTDGLTVKYRRRDNHKLYAICDWWQKLTRLELEFVEYKAMYIRDVNNYIAVSSDDSIKRKGDYQTAHPRDRKPLGWHQNTSMMVVPKVAEQALIYGADIEQAVAVHHNNFDFLMRTKVPRSSKLFVGDIQSQNITRFSVTYNGGALVKVMPPTPAQLKKDPNAPYRRISVAPCTGWNVTECNDLDDFDPSQINLNFYIQQIHDLVDPILKGGLI